MALTKRQREKYIEDVVRRFGMVNTIARVDHDYGAGWSIYFLHRDEGFACSWAAPSRLYVGVSHHQPMWFYGTILCKYGSASYESADGSLDPEPALAWLRSWCDERVARIDEEVRAIANDPEGRLLAGAERVMTDEIMVKGCSGMNDAYFAHLRQRGALESWDDLDGLTILLSRTEATLDRAGVTGPVRDRWLEVATTFQAFFRRHADVEGYPVEVWSVH